MQDWPAEPIACYPTLQPPQYVVFLGLMHEMHTDPKSEANLVCQSVCQCVTLWTRGHMTDLRGINGLAGRPGTSNCE